jgi:hydroxymethylpyrimidine pyrophosphatase-like HAD family hydrolase
MLRLVGLGVAMGNAVPPALAAADAITAANSEDGVARAIERFVLKPRGLV